MGALGHYLEAEGVPTTSISLVREHTEVIRPPRALWVTFDLGRPLGAPGDAALQTRVLRAALKLLEADSGPVLVDYPESAPEADFSGWVCPIRLPVAAASVDGIAAVLLREIAALAPWYDRAVARNGRTTFGLSGLSAEQAGTFLAGFTTDGPAPATPPGWTVAEAIKRTTDDLKAFYMEALCAQPGGTVSARQQADWLWGETTLGQVLLRLQPIFAASADPAIKRIGTLLLVPAIQMHRLAGGHAAPGQ